MTKLVSISDVRSVLARPPDEELNRSISAAIETVTPIFASYLRTEFDKVSGVATYDMMQSEVYRLYEERYYGFDFGRGFCDISVTPTLKLIDDLGDLDTTDPFDLSHAHIDYQRGYMIVIKDRRATNYAQITFDAGMETIDDEVGLLYTGVPDWLTAAAMQYSLVVFDATREIQNTDTKYAPPVMPAVVANALAQYRRNRQDVITPLWPSV